MDVEETVDTVAEVVKESSNKWVPALGGLVALGVGLGIGYILGKRKSYQVIKLGDRPVVRPPKVILDEQDLKEPKELPTPMRTMRIPANEEEEGPEVTVNEVVVERTTVFATTAAEDDEWDYDEEIKRRNPFSPYVIHRDEFFAEEMETEDFVQSTLTYYAGDDVLVGEDEKPIYNAADLVGDLKFGHGSGDPNTVYIRNMSQQQEFEVIKDPGRYDVEVLGNDVEDVTAGLKHSKGVPKFRRE